ncbi:hypothetical protein [Aestuariivirga sp.]|uniref:hypothetical protein n=1 Tax=Aestuariivirga sp. TaxID=2650926 RepID=UPI0039E4FED7
MTEDITHSTVDEAPSAPQRRSTRWAAMAFGAVALLMAGAGAGGIAVNALHPTAVMAPMQPAAISAMQDWSTVTIKGQVVELFGNKFVVEDQSGRALVETGRAGEDGTLVNKAETVTVQGRFEHGFIHAQFIVHADGKTVSVEPPHPPGPHDWMRHVLGAATPPMNF